MKKKIISVILIIILIFSVVFISRNKVYADPFTAGQIASTSYALFNSWGISFTATNASASGMSNFMTNEIESYVNSRGGSISDVFIGDIAVDVAGKLVVAQDMYNSILTFGEWLKDKYSLSSEDFSLCNGFIDGKEIGKDTASPEVIQDSGLYPIYGSPKTNTHGVTFYQSAKLYNGPYLVSTQTITGNYGWSLGYSIDYYGNQVRLLLPRYSVSDGIYRGVNAFPVATTGQFPVTDSLSWNGSDYIEPTVLNPDKEWTGTIGGYSVPDTNLDQLLGNIDQAVADNNLVVDGEVIDIPIPTPTPVPIDPGTPLGDVPWEGLDTNLQNLYDQGLEEIGKIGEAQDAITDSIYDQTGALEGAIADNAGVVSGAIDQAVSDVNQGLQTQTGALSGAIGQAVSDVTDAINTQTEALSETAAATAAATEDIADALEDESINWRKFDLRGLFPFCIPFDIYNMLQAFDAAPIAPHVQLPFVIESIGFSYTIDLDFSGFDQVAAVMRQMELIVYGIALAWATSKVIKW